MTKDKIHVLSRAVLIEDNQILLCKTQDLENNFFFLPGGHVEHGESVTQTLLRELEEEAGHTCQIQKLLGVLEYSFEPGQNSICHNHEYSFFFKITSQTLKPGFDIPQMEKHIKLSWVSLIDLQDIDFRPEPLKKCLPAWLKESDAELFQSYMHK